MTPLVRAALLGCALLITGPLGAGAAEGPKAPESGPTLQPAPPLSATPVTPVVAGPGDPKPATPKPAGSPGGEARPGLNETQQYCQNIAAAAADARFAWQRKQLTDLQAQIKQRVADLEAKEAEFKAAAARREEMLKKASEAIVGIYGHMKPDAAAAQLAELDESMAASILAQLTQQKASSILNEIPAEKAAKLVTAMTAGMAPEKKS